VLAPSGEQIELALVDQRAVIVQVGGAKFGTADKRPGTRIPVADGRDA
jgi:hypothetical protein